MLSEELKSKPHQVALSRKVRHVHLGVRFHFKHEKRIQWGSSGLFTLPSPFRTSLAKLELSDRG